MKLIKTYAPSTVHKSTITAVYILSPLEEFSRIYTFGSATECATLDFFPSHQLRLLLAEGRVVPTNEITRRKLTLDDWNLPA